MLFNAQSRIIFPKSLASKTSFFAPFSTCPISHTKLNLFRRFAQRLNAQSQLNSTISVAYLHQSSRRPILPPLPQVIHGTANDAAPVPSPEPSHGSYHWTFERLISAGLIPLTLAPFAAGSLNPTIDALLCGAILIHSHIGFQSVIIDYLPRKRVPTLRLIFWWALRAATVTVGIGLYEFETNDVGLTEAIRRIWKA
nr:succinate dehydrogenase subunit D [Leveillula taurica]BCM29958.1 succinate dehydrogenase subunit D [Leveillula taurica]BCM29959.1 succinate dehydrogenase subunit D [Leveillula taurica]BCM29960.1 succinate dehydrogenase subunit D [Leveillula taurica]BCM29961.1 succinate dehydrogenase subunit D [Leveillula taurica]